MVSADGKKRLTDVANTEQRLRIEEIVDSELSIDGELKPILARAVLASSRGGWLQLRTKFFEIVVQNCGRSIPPELQRIIEESARGLRRKKASRCIFGRNAFSRGKVFNDHCGAAVHGGVYRVGSYLQTDSLPSNVRQLSASSLRKQY